jgi:hypothetical protein
MVSSSSETPLPFPERYYHLTKRRFPPGVRRYSSEVFRPITRLARASLVDLLEIRRPVLGQEIELPLVRHHNRDLAIADDPGVLPILENSGEFCSRPPPARPMTLSAIFRAFDSTERGEARRGGLAGRRSRSNGRSLRSTETASSATDDLVGDLQSVRQYGEGGGW